MFVCQSCCLTSAICAAERTPDLCTSPQRSLSDIRLERIRDTSASGSTFLHARNNCKTTLKQPTQWQIKRTQNTNSRDINKHQFSIFSQTGSEFQNSQKIIVLFQKTVIRNPTKNNLQKCKNPEKLSDGATFETNTK